MKSTRKPGWPTSSHASPLIPPIGWTSCYPGIGCHRRQRSWSKRRDYTRQQGPSRHHYRPRCRTARRRRRLATRRCQRNGNRGQRHLGLRRRRRRRPGVSQATPARTVCYGIDQRHRQRHDRCRTAPAHRSPLSRRRMGLAKELVALLEAPATRVRS